MRPAPETLRLMPITDRRFSPLPLVEQVRAALLGGATIIQYREKELAAREALETGLELRKLTREFGVPFIVNDRVDWALALEADGVHLGRSDMPIPIARRLLGPRAIIGATGNTETEIRARLSEGADYLGVGAIFPTATKPDHSSVIGFLGLAALCRAVRAPLIAIGGLNLENAHLATKSGATGVAVVQALWSQADIQAATAALLGEVARGEALAREARA